MALNKRIWRVLRENKAQYLGSIALILLSSLMFTLMTHVVLNFERLAKEFQQGAVQEDASFTTAEPIGDLRELEVAANATIEEGMSLDVTLADGNKLRIFSQNERVNLPAVVAGSGLSGSGEILISPVFAEANSYHIGDQLTILDRPFTIVGFVALPNYIYPLQSEDMLMFTPDFGVAIISKEDSGALGQGSRFYALKFNDPGQSARAQSLQFKELLRERGIQLTQWTDIEDNRRVNIVAVEVEILKTMSRVVPIGVLLLVSIMVGNIIARMLKREAPIIGALYALGYRRKEIYRHYLLFPLLIAVVGGAIGTILGVFPVRAMVSFLLTAFIMPLTGITIDPAVMLLSLLLPVLFLGLSGFVVIRRALRHTPVELMRGTREAYKVNPLERLLNLERLSFRLKFQLREHLRSLSRLVFLLFGVTVATMLLLWGFALQSGFDKLLTSGVTDTYDFVYEYAFDELRYEPLPAGAEPASSALFVPVGDDTHSFYVTGIMPNSSMLTLVDETGARLSTDQVIITRPLANQLKATPGSTVTIVRKLDGRNFTLQIDRIAETYSGKFIFMPWAEFNRSFGMPEGSYNGAFSNVLLDLPADQSYSVVTLEEKIAGVREVIAPTRAMIGVLAALAFIIGVIVIYVVTSLMVEESRQTISLMKIFGYRQREINALILNSSTFVVVLGYLIGIPLILAALGAVLQLFEASIGLSLPPGTISPLYLLIGFVTVMLSYELSKLLCRKKIAAVSMSEALKAGTE